jgi:hypothetical protein
MNASDPSAALSDLLDAPANVVNAVFNGADLNLDALVPLINNAGILPAGTTIDALDVAFGGLFTVGSVSQGTYTQNGKAVPITTPGGSILNSLGLTITTDALTPGTPLTIPFPSHAVGPLGALESISQTVGVLLGDHWDGKGAVQVPPLSGLHFPTLSDTAEDPAAVNAATPATAQAGAASLPSTAAKSVTLSVGSTAASIPAKTETSAESSADGKSTEAPASKPESTDTTKSATAPESTSDTAESASTTKDSTTKADPAKASDGTKPSETGTDVTTGNKVEPHNPAGSDTPKSGDKASSTGSHDATAENAGSSSSTATSGGAEKATAKGTHTASHGRHAK